MQPRVAIAGSREVRVSREVAPGFESPRSHFLSSGSRCVLKHTHHLSRARSETRRPRRRRGSSSARVRRTPQIRSEQRHSHDDEQHDAACGFDGEMRWIGVALAAAARRARAHVPGDIGPGARFLITTRDRMFSGQERRRRLRCAYGNQSASIPDAATAGGESTKAEALKASTPRRARGHLTARCERDRPQGCARTKPQPPCRTSRRRRS